MARPLRIEYPHALYHVTSRGNARENIFYDRKDREFFFDLLDELKDVGVEVVFDVSEEESNL